MTQILTALLIFAAGAAAGVFVTLYWRRRRFRSIRRANERWARLATRALTGEDAVDSDQLDIDPAAGYADARNFYELIRLEENRLEAILNAIGEGLALVNTEGVVVRCNPSFTASFGIMTGDPILNANSRRSQSADYESAFRQCLETQTIQTTEIGIRTTPPRTMMVSFCPFRDETLDNGLIVTAFDITSLRAAEQMRTEFVANVSHELRTPLAAIRGYVETLLDMEPHEVSDAAERFVPIIHQHALRLNALIEDLLVLSRIESSGMQLSPAPMQLQDAVDHVIETLKPSAAEKRVTLQSQLPELLPEVLADVSAVERILSNLIENAIKYSPEKTTVRISARTLSNELCVTVSDEGIGITKEHLARIFERFYRVDKARSREAGGTGLGLSIVKHLVQAQRGEVWVESEPGKGSSFSFTIPVACHKEEHSGGLPVEERYHTV